MWKHSVHRMIAFAWLASLLLPGAVAPAVAQPVAGSGYWSEQSYTPREGATAILDRTRSRMIVFGGADAGGDHNDVWAFPLSGPPRWTRLETQGTPPAARSEHSAIYDPNGDRMIVFGGRGDAGFLGDLWQLSLTGMPQWTQLTPIGTLPGGRRGHRAVYAPNRKAMIIHGGVDVFRLRNEIFLLTLTGTMQWTQKPVPVEGPAARRDHVVIYDPQADRLVVSGGYALNDSADTWALPLEGQPVWQRLAKSGAVPVARQGHEGFYDSEHHRLVIHGGKSGPTALADVWALPLGDGAQWAALPASGAAGVARHSHVALLDAVNDRLLVAGGSSGTAARNDVAEMPMTAPRIWLVHVPNDTLPAARSGQAMLYDPPRQRALVLGGDTGAPFMPGDLWEWSSQPWPHWNPLAPAGTAPPARQHAAFIRDGGRDRALLMGGVDESGNVFGDLWELPLGAPPAWAPLAPMGVVPDARWGHALVHDTTRDRLLLLGGRDAAGVALADVWELPLAGPLQWAPIAAGGTPPAARSQFACVYDAARDQVVLFGGRDGAGAPLGDTWMLSLGGGAQWQAGPTAGAPAARFGASFAMDAARDRLLLVDGGDAVGSLADNWVLSLAGTPAWSALWTNAGLPGARRAASAAFDADGDRLLMYGGLGETTRLGDLWEMRLSGVLAVEGDAAAPAVSAVRAPWPNPMRDRTLVRWSQARAGRASVGLYDLGGRLVRMLTDGERAAGDHSSEWDGRDGRGATVEPGIYFVRVATPGASATRKVVRVR